MMFYEKVTGNFISTILKKKINLSNCITRSKKTTCGLMGGRDESLKAKGNEGQ